MAEQVINTVIKFRRGTSEEWAVVDPILREGEPGYDTKVKKIKIGDGITRWTGLPYQGEVDIEEITSIYGGSANS